MLDRADPMSAESFADYCNFGGLGAQAAPRRRVGVERLRT